MNSAEIVICGAGMAGIATAYQLAVKHGIRNITLADEGPPLSLTSAVGREISKLVARWGYDSVVHEAFH